MLFFIPFSVCADYWDCQVEFSSKRWDMVAYSNSVIFEIESKSRSDAEYIASTNGFHAYKNSVLGRKEMYVCPLGKQDSNRGVCYYAIDRVKCERQ